MWRMVTLTVHITVTCTVHVLYREYTMPWWSVRRKDIEMMNERTNKKWGEKRLLIKKWLLFDRNILMDKWGDCERNRNPKEKDGDQVDNQVERKEGNCKEKWIKTFSSQRNQNHGNGNIPLTVITTWVRGQLVLLKSYIHSLIQKVVYSESMFFNLFPVCITQSHLFIHYTIDSFRCDRMR